MGPVEQAAVLVVAGVVAGALGSAGAITSLVSYPALIAAGVPALTANVANIVAGTALWPGSALTSRAELRGRGEWVVRHLAYAAAGAAVGVVLLVRTPAAGFERIVPYLVAVGALTLLFAPVLTRRRTPAAEAAPAAPAAPAVRARRSRGVGLAVLAVSVYAGYFGAGSGVMTLAVMLVAVTPDLPTANALKNMLIGVGSLVATLALVVLSPVDWAVTIPLAVGMLLGSTQGPRIARAVPAPVLRTVVGLVGLAFAVHLWLD